MKVLVVYGSTEGQTRKIAQFILARLTEAGHSVAVLPAETADAEGLDRYDGVIVAGSVHAGKYQKSLRKWVRKAGPALAARPNLFLSVSLAAAGDDPDDWKGLEDGVARFSEKTGWTPRQVAHVAGAYKFSEYDFFRTLAMRWIAAQKGQTIAPGEDHEYTDWPALEALVTEWVGTLSAA